MATGERNAVCGTVFPEVFLPSSYANEEIFLLSGPTLARKLGLNDQ